MKRILITFLSLLLCISAVAQYEIKDKSSKAPKWLNSVEQGYLIVEGIGSSIEEAQNNCLNNLKQQISESVAVRVIATSELSEETSNQNNKFTYSSEFKNSVKSRTAKLPFINSISLSKVKDYYWEKRYYRKNKSTKYSYNIKYPFTQYDLHKLISEFTEHDNKLNESLNLLESNLNNINSIEEIGKNIENLKYLRTEFSKEDPRYTKCLSLISYYMKQYDNIVIVSSQNKKGEIIVKLMLNNKLITSSQKPAIKASWDSPKIKFSLNNDSYVINFDDYGCYPEDDNSIMIRVRSGNKFIYEKIHVKLKLSQSIAGIIIDKKTHEPIPYANIRLSYKETISISNNDGTFDFYDIPKGEYNITASAPGYETVHSIIDINNKIFRAQIETNRIHKTSTVITSQFKDESPTSPLPISEKEIPQTISTPKEIQIRDGLTAYYRFDGDGVDANGSSIKAFLLNNAKFSNDSQDGSKCVELNALEESFISIPRSMLSFTTGAFTTSFWVKGISNGHIFSNSNGGNRALDNNPSMLMIDSKIAIVSYWENSTVKFNHNKIDYKWHFIALSYEDEKVSLYIDGDLLDSTNLNGINDNEKASKFILGGKSPYSSNPSINMKVDNLRFYNSRKLSDEEIRTIYESEK